MAGFHTHRGKLGVVPGDNIDTDRIIPARFLTRVTRSGYGNLLFCDVRGPEFSLDQPAAAGASIMVVGTNFGCGSSREHAVWAIQQAGYATVIARKTDSSPGYGDIFRQNAANCGLLLIELEPDQHVKLVSAGSGAKAEIDLPNQSISLQDEVLRFEINPAVKSALVEGLDLIGTTLRHAEEIASYEAREPAWTAPSSDMEPVLR